MRDIRYLMWGFIFLATCVVLASFVTAYVQWRMIDHQSAPYDVLDASVVGHDYRLHFRYPGKDRILHTDDDRFAARDLYVPAGAVVRLSLNSRDYIYTIEIPKVGVYEIAAPDLKFDVQFVAPGIGTHDLLGSQMCGYDHPDLIGKMVTQSQTEFERTMNRLSSTPEPMLP